MGGTCAEGGPDAKAKVSMFQYPTGQRSREKPRLRYMDDVDEDLVNIGVRGWKRRALDRAEWSKVLK